MLKPLRLLPVCLLLLVPATRAADPAAQKEEDAAALKVLTYFDGEWDITFGENGVGHKRTILLMDGYMMQQVGSLAGKDGQTGVEFVTIMTYDRKEKAYRIWQFLGSPVNPMQGTATWDEASKTLTTKYPEQNWTVIQDFSEPDKERWKWGDATGLNTRTK